VRVDDLIAFPSYRPTPGRYDELVDARREVRPGWAGLARTYGHVGAAEVERRRTLADRLLLAEGASHALHAESDASRPWRVDPLPYVIDAGTWVVLARGLTQRARLLDALLDDLYGPARSLQAGVLPAEAVLAAPSFLRPCQGVAPVAGRRLVVYAADLVRDAAGRWLVLRDHTDAPSGAGYALLNRRVLARLFPDIFRELRVQPLDEFFSRLRAGLAAQAPPDRANPRTVVLSPGLGHPSYVEHSYLATHLGYHLAEGGDLTVRGDHVWLRALDGLEPVDVVLRRVDDAGADPLELAAGRPGGVPALLHAARAGGVGMANGLGSGLAGHLTLLPFLADLCPWLLGEPLALASVPTLWCGDPDHRRRALDDLGSMVLHDGHGVHPSVFAWDCGGDELAAWQERLEREPHRVVAQHRLDFGTTPCLDQGVVVPGSVVVRALVVASPDGYEALPGGLGRVVDPGVPVLGQRTGLSKDVWVVGGTDVRPSRHSLAVEVPPIDLRSSLPSRSAEALCWVGRNAERAETVARVLGSALTRFEQAPELAELAGGRWLTTALASVRAVSGRAGPADATGPLDLRDELAAAASGRPGSLADALGHLGSAASSVREFLSTSTWRLLGSLEAARLALDGAVAGDEGPHDLFEVNDALERVVITLAAFAGLTAESVVRGPGWRFLDIGRRLERAVLLLNLVEAALLRIPEPEVRQPLYEHVLASCESLVVYRRRYRSDLELGPLCELLLVDDTNPRSLAFQLDRLVDDLIALPDRRAKRDHLALVHAAQAALLDIDLHGTARPDSTGRYADLAQLVLDARGALLALSDGLMSEWFAHTDARPVRGDVVR
jgi:uncharacterized circularly permuted ATP-grasp superfamily protein/uncharacterized alpha-E superfamily protein